MDIARQLHIYLPDGVAGLEADKPSTEFACLSPLNTSLSPFELFYLNQHYRLVVGREATDEPGRVDTNEPSAESACVVS